MARTGQDSGSTEISRALKSEKFWPDACLGIIMLDFLEGNHV